MVKVNLVLEGGVRISGNYENYNENDMDCFDNEMAHNTFVSIRAIPEETKDDISVESIIPGEDFFISINKNHVMYYWFD